MYRSELCVCPHLDLHTDAYSSTDRPHPARDHIAELNNVRPKQPFFFLKPTSSILPRSHGPVLRPKGVTLHYEVELAVIIGKQIRNLDPEDEKGAMDAIHG